MCISTAYLTFPLGCLIVLEVECVQHREFLVFPPKPTHLQSFPSHQKHHCDMAAQTPHHSCALSLPHTPHLVHQWVCWLPLRCTYSSWSPCSPRHYFSWGLWQCFLSALSASILLPTVCSPHNSQIDTLKSTPVIFLLHYKCFNGSPSYFKWNPNSTHGLEFLTAGPLPTSLLVSFPLLVSLVHSWPHAFCCSFNTPGSLLYGHFSSLKQCLWQPLQVWSHTSCRFLLKQHAFLNCSI